LPGPEHVEVASLLLDKARADLEAARALASDERQADHIVGFHAQQAVEKSAKAVLAIRSIEMPRTHDLAYLLALLEDGGLEVSEEVVGSEWLTPWAGAWRYDEAPSPIDRERALRVAQSALDWAQGLVGPGAASRDG